MSFSFIGNFDSALYYRDFRPDAPQHSALLTIERVGINFGAIDWNFHEPGKHVHCLYYNRDPGSRVVLDDRVVPLDPGTVVFIPAGTLFDAVTSRSVRHLFIEFKQTAFSHPLDRVHTLDAGIQLASLLKSLYDAMSEEKKNEVVCLAIAVVHLMAIKLDIQCRTLPEELSNLLATIPRNRFRDTSSTLARQIGYSTARFCRWFGSYMSVSPSEYMRQAQITEATRLLQSTNESVEEIADHCGFSNRFYFTRVFAAAMKVGPSEFRKKAAARFSFQENPIFTLSPFVPFAAVTATAKSWRFLSLGNLLNRRWSGVEAWFGHYPLHLDGGRKTVSDVPLRLADKSMRYQCILLRSSRIARHEGTFLPNQVIITVDEYLSAAFIFHGCGWVTGPEHIADYSFSYADGKSHLEPLWTFDNEGAVAQSMAKAGIADWCTILPPLSNLHVRPYIIPGTPRRPRAALYLFKLFNPHPKVKVRSIILRARPKTSVPLAILAVTLQLAKRTK